ncbi:ATP-binding protein [Pseudonocardia sichuanensis]|uniref:Regulatory LuxR family protein n=1 Tax=Pseudonocardia kunmingensis TaxID=630975 RepID=A0A543DQY9_9PSEU|nr:LuxR family transcriptional regulator [Pseudonocardia kunmingensis]TQM11738.1 regulatory LuxR family protein [Pseudonocardia kunmingensis]
MELAERDELLGELAEHLDGAAAGRGRLVLLCGEAGIGKTAVVHRFAQLVGPRARILTGACDPLSTPSPLGPLADCAAGLGPSLRRALDVALDGVGGSGPVFRELLTELGAKDRPTVLVVEDVHWADAATLDLLRFLARRIESTTTLVLTTYRDDEVSPEHPLAVVLGDLAGSAATCRHEVQPLSRAAVAAMAAEPGVDRAVDAETLYQRTRGNPFFVTEVLAAPAGSVPLSVRDAVLGRMARCAPGVRAVVEAVAVIGSPAPVQLVDSVLADVQGVLRDGLARGLLQARGHIVEFRHELARAAVLDAIPAYRRAELHRRVLAQLRADGSADDLPRLAHHAEQAGDARAVLEFAPRAGDSAAAVGAHREAAAQYGRALRHAVGAAPDHRAGLLERRAYSLYLTGVAGDAVAAWRDAAELRARAGDRLREGHDLCWASYILWLLGSNAEARELGLRAVRVLEVVPPGVERALAYLNLAEQASFDYDPRTAIEYAQRAARLGEELEHLVVTVRARFAVAIARVFRCDEGWDELDEIWNTVATHGTVELAGMFPVMSAAAVVHRHFARARRFDEHAVAYCRERDLDMFLGHLGGARAFALLFQDRWEEATQEAASVLRYTALPPLSRLFPLVTLGLVRARRGDPDSWPLLEEAAGSGSWEYMVRLGAVYQARAEAHWLAGDDEAALAEVRRGLAAVTEDSDPWMVGALARWARLAGGDAPAVPAAGPFALELAGDWREAARAWEALGCRYDAALARLAGDAAALGQALEAFESLGARPAAARARQRLRHLGVRYGHRGPRAATRANPHGLTTRQLEILQLVAEGLTGPEIAARLHLSPKTVGHHVAATLATLGVHSRADAVRTVFGGSDH